MLVAAAAGALGNGTAIQVGDANTGSGAPSTLGPAQLLISGLNTFSQNITVNAASATLGNLTDDNAGFGGTITLNSSLTISSQSVSPGNSLTFSGNIVHGSGTNSVTLSGPGNVVFLGAATYQGATTINGGYLTVGATGALPSTTTLNINNGSTVELDNAAQTLAGLNGSAQSTLNLFNGSGAALTVGGGSFAGTITDNANGASLVKNTSGNLYLTGANIYYGSTTVTAGALLYGSMNSVSTVAGNGSITIGTSGAVGLEASGLGSLLPYLTSGTSSTGTLVVTPATSADAVNLGAYSLSYLSLGALDSETYTGLLTPSGTNYRLGGGGGTLTYPAALTDMTGSMGLVVNGPASGGAVILTSTGNSYTGTTTISYGTLQVGDGLTTNGSLPNNAVTDGGALVFANPSNMTFTGVISGNGQLAKTGAGLLVLPVNDTYSNGTTISAGTLQLGSGGTTGAAGTGAIVNFGTLAYTRTDTANTNTLANNISGSGSLTINGGGLVVLTGSNTFTGITTISNGSQVALTNVDAELGPAPASFVSNQLSFTGVGGTLINMGAGFPSGNNLTIDASRGIFVASGATATFRTGYAGVNITVNSVISGGGGIAKTDTTTDSLILNAANTFSGTTAWNTIGGQAQGGLIQLGNSAALQFSTVNENATAGGNLTFTGSIGTFIIGGLTGTVNQPLTDLNNAAVTLLVGNNNASTVYTGVLSGAGALTKIGNGLLQLTGANTFTGNLTVSGGTLEANYGQGGNTNPASSALGNPQTAGRTITVGSGATLWFPQGNAFGGGTTVPLVTLAIQQGATVINTANNNNQLGPVTLSGGTLTGTGGGQATYQMYTFGAAATGLVTATGSANSAISLTGTGNGFNGFQLATSNTFDVAGPGSLTVSIPLMDRDAGQGAVAPLPRRRPADLRRGQHL